MSTAPSKIGVPMSVITLSSVRKLEKRVRRICKDISVRRSSVDYHRSRIAFQEELISKLLEDLQATTVRIVQRMETSGKPVRVPTPEDERIETSSQSSGSPLSRIVAPMSSAAQTLAASRSPDIRCYETVWELPSQLIDLTSTSSGSGENLELESLDWPTNDFLEHILKSPERSGGLDTCWSQMSL